MRIRAGGRFAALTVAVRIVLAGNVGTGTPAGAKGGGATDAPHWLGSRTTADGVQLRVSKASIDPRVGFPQEVNGVQIPADCYPDEMVTVGVSTARIAESVTSTFRSSSDGTVVSAPTAGVATPYATVDDEPRPVVQVVIVRTPKGATTVEATATGWRDEATVRGGYAVLARKTRLRLGSRLPPSKKLVRVTVRDDGTVVDRTSQSFGRTQSGFIDMTRSECRPTEDGGSVIIAVPGPTLPDAVGPPPVDEASAHDAVVAAFEGAYAAGGDADASLAHVDGGDSGVVRHAQETASTANSQYKGRVSASVAEVRFLDDSEAAVRFELLLDGDPFLGERIGFAVRTPDGWKVSRSTYCSLLASGGGQC